MKRWFYNKKGHADARNVLAIWSFFKWIVDFLILVVGGGFFAHQSPTGSILYIAYILWTWTFIKFAIDTPLVLVWLWGKIKHKKRKKKKKRETKRANKARLLKK